LLKRQSRFLSQTGSDDEFANLTVVCGVHTSTQDKTFPKLVLVVASQRE